MSRTVTSEFNFIGKCDVTNSRLKRPDDPGFSLVTETQRVSQALTLGFLPFACSSLSASSESVEPSYFQQKSSLSKELQGYQGAKERQRGCCDARVAEAGRGGAPAAGLFTCPSYRQ